MRRLCANLKWWVGGILFPGCWFSWQGVASDEEIWIGSHEEKERLLPTQGRLWVGVMGICPAPKSFVSPVVIYYRRGLAWYRCELPIVWGRRYQFDPERLQIVYSGGELDLEPIGSR